MSKFTDAADAIKRQLKTMEQWQVAAEALEGLGSLDNATKEATAAMQAAQKERDAVMAEVAKAKADAKAAKDKVAATLLTAEAEAEKIVNEAKEKASGVEASAKSQAEEIVALAKANAAAMSSTARANLDTLKQQTDAADFKLKETLAQVAEAEDKLAKATKQLDTLKGKLAALMG
jgi:chromosome segregation ATPase